MGRLVKRAGTAGEFSSQPSEPALRLVGQQPTGHRRMTAGVTRGEISIQRQTSFMRFIGAYELLMRQVRCSAAASGKPQSKARAAGLWANGPDSLLKIRDQTRVLDAFHKG